MASKKLTTVDFVGRAIKVHGDTYDYSKVDYKHSQIKIKIICKEHGEFLQRPSSHSNGAGCLACSGNKIPTTEEFIEKAIKVHGDTYDYSKVDYKKSQIKIKIICKTHGEFLQTPDCHLRGNGCLSCGNKVPTTEEFVTKAIKVHGDTYDYSKVDYKKSQIKIKIICKEHGEFLQTPDNHLNGRGCLACSGNKALTTEEFIEKAIKVHGDTYDYSKVDYKTNRINIKIICKEHGEFLQTPNNHLNSRGCLACSGNKAPTTEEFIEKAIKVHGDTYNYSKVDYKTNKTKIKIICKEHGEFLQTPKHHLRGAGCPACGGVKVPTTEEFIENAIKVHGDTYDYSRVDYKTNKTKIKIICKEHGEFLQAPNPHLSGAGCPKHHQSKNEVIISEWLTNNNIKFIEQYRNPTCKYKFPLPFDFYLPDKNILIECDGQQHFEPVCFGGISQKKAEARFKIQQKCDQIKNEWAKNNGKFLLRIPYFCDTVELLNENIKNYDRIRNTTKK